MIMVIDDQQSVLNLTKTVINHSYDSPVHIFLSPNKAIDFFKEHNQDVNLVISDLEMPDMNGCELIESLKKINPNVKMGLSSGCINKEGELMYEHQCPKADFLVSKPFELYVMQGILRTYLGEPK